MTYMQMQLIPRCCHSVIYWPMASLSYLMASVPNMGSFSSIAAACIIWEYFKQYHCILQLLMTIVVSPSILGIYIQIHLMSLIELGIANEAS